MTQITLALSTILSLLCSGSFAEAIPQEIALRVARSDSQTVVELTLADLRRMPQTSVDTKNEFVDDVVHFSGPLVREVIDLVGRGTARQVQATAANDYKVTIPITDFYEYDVIIAMEADDEKLSRRDKGPLWIIYPMSQFAELRDPIYNNRLIWQVVRLDLK